MGRRCGRLEVVAERVYERPMRRVEVLLFALLVAGCATRGHARLDARSRPTSANRLSGLLLYVEYEPYHSRLMWLDLATGATGKVDDEDAGGATIHIAGRTAVWLMGLKAGGTLRITRRGSGVATWFVPGVFVGTVSSDDTRAVIVGDRGEYVYARITSTGFQPVGRLDLDPFSLLYAWRDGGVIASPSDGHTVQRAAPGERRVTLRSDVVATDGTVGSHDGAMLAWVPSAYDAMTSPDTSVAPIELVLHVASLTDVRAPVRTIRLGTGLSTECAFAPDDHRVVCVVEETQGAEGRRALAVDRKSSRCPVLTFARARAALAR